MPAKRPRVLQTFNRETDEIVVQPHDAVAGLRGNDYFPGPRGSGLHHLGEDYVIQVRRYLCRACRRTVSLLPEFLLPYLRFAIEGIASFLKARLWSGQTLKAAAESAHQSTMPYRRAKMSLSIPRKTSRDHPHIAQVKPRDSAFRSSEETSTLTNVDSASHGNG